MAKVSARASTPNDEGAGSVSGFDAMLLASMSRGEESLETGRYIVTYSPEGAAESKALLESMSLSTADARDFKDQAVDVQDVAGADALILPEIGVAVVSSPDFAERAIGVAEDSGNPVEVIEPEYFVFAADISREYLMGFRRAVEVIAADAGFETDLFEGPADISPEALGATWGLTACEVPTSTQTGAGIKVAVLDTGMALRHPDFAGRTFASASFVGEPVQDLHGHGTHCIGTSCGPLSPPGTTPRYGIAYKATIFAGKVLSNSGSGATGSVLAGINWAIANGCVVISMSLGSQSPPQAGYTAAGRAALNKGCLIVAAAGNAGSQTGAPANSPTIMSVASLDMNLKPSSFSNFGKIEIAAPGRDVFSAAPMPRRTATMSGTSMATPHVAGCAALWAQTSPNLRGQALWNKLLSTAKPLNSPAARVGSGLVRAPA